MVKNKTYIFVILLILLDGTQMIYSQTKLIAHKSHSGNTNSFHRAMKYSIFNLEASNFGEAPSPFVNTAQLDTLKYVSDSVAVMITSNCRKNRFTKKTDSLWTPGKDTIYNHPLFSKKNALDSIKRVLRETYYFENSIDSVVFIGYNNTIKTLDKRNKKNSLPPILNNNTRPPSNFKLIGLFTILILAIIIGLVYKKASSDKRVV